MKLSNAVTAIPQEDTLPSTDPEAGSDAPARRQSNLSQASARYDVGDKGFLSQSERVIREYDTNDDGKLDLNEVKKIVRDLKDVKSEKNFLKKIAMGGGALLLLSFLGNFGLTWAVLTLTRQLDTNEDGNIVDAHTGKRMATEPRGNLETAKINPEYTRRLADIERRRLVGEDVSHDEVERMLSGTPVATFDDCNADCMRDHFSSYQQGVPSSWTFTLDGTDYTGVVDVGVTHSTDADQCDIYDNIIEVGVPETVYNCKCCGTNPCEGYSTSVGNRRCFSSKSTVFEKSKGKMLLKDLKFGDLVLAADGIFRPFLFPIHFSEMKPTSFVQIHTDSSEDSPLEITDDHFIFVEKKELPVQAGKVAVGDKLVGTDGPKTVTKITRVTREGFFSALTSDATHFVDGILTSSNAPHNGEEFVIVGPVKVHLHTLFNRFIAPVTNIWCNKMHKKFCMTKQVDDGEGGTINAMLKACIRVLEMPTIVQAFVAPFAFGVVVITMLSYYLAWILLYGAFVLRCVAQVKKGGEKTKEKAL